MNSNYVPSPELVHRLALVSPYSHVWWEDQLRLVLRTEMVPEEDLEDFALSCVSCADGKLPLAPAWVAEMFFRLKNYHTTG